MANQDRAKHERLLNLAGWLHHKHRYQTLVPGAAYTEVRFTREDLGNVPALAVYGLDTGDAGEQALYRDTSALGEFGIEIRWEPSTQMWVSRVVPFTDAEYQALASAALSVILEDGSVNRGQYQVREAGLSTQGAEVIVAYASVIDTLIEAVQSRRTVRFRHRGSGRIIDPWHVLMIDGRWYVVGRDHDAHEQRVFAVDAIEDLQAVGAGGRYEIPRIDYSELGHGAVDPDSWASCEPVEVELEVDRRLAARAETLLGAVSTDSSAATEWVQMICSVRNLDAFIDRLWGLRARARVTAPPHLRRRITAILEGML